MKNEILKCTKNEKEQHKYNKVPNTHHAISKLVTFDLQVIKKLLIKIIEMLEKEKLSLLKKNSIKSNIKVYQYLRLWWWLLPGTKYCHVYWPPCWNECEIH